jgi:hypothetical protein
MRKVRCTIFAVTVFVLVVCVHESALATAINLGIYPETGEVVPPNAPISDEWRAIGILFSARTQSGPPGSLTPISGGSGPDPNIRYLFFSPDIYGAVAIFEFVEPGSSVVEDVVYFEIDPGFDSPSESVELVGFDENGSIIAQEVLTGTDPDVPVSISGQFRTVEYRTFGNPGIGTLSSDIWFVLLSAVSAPQYSENGNCLANPAPNPFNPQTTITFTLDRPQRAEVAVYDLTGRLLNVLANRSYDVGDHSVVWNGKDAAGRAVPSGTYIVRLFAETEAQARKVMLLR